MKVKLVQNQLGEYGVVDSTGAQYVVDSTGSGWAISSVYWTNNKAKAIAAKAQHQQRLDEETARNTYTEVE